MEEMGVSLPRGRKRKRTKQGRKYGEKKERREDTAAGKGGSSEVEWNEVRKYMDPNPQLKGVPLGKNAPKVIDSVPRLSLL